MSKFDVRGYRLLKMKYIYITMFIYFLVFTIMNIAASGTAGLLLIPMFCLAFGWQMGCLTERNDWQTYYEKKNEKDRNS